MSPPNAGTPPSRGALRVDATSKRYDETKDTAQDLTERALRLGAARIAAVVPVEAREVFVPCPVWYGRHDATLEPLELVAIVLLDDGRCLQLVLDEGAPQLLDDDGEIAYESKHPLVRPLMKYSGRYPRTA